MRVALLVLLVSAAALAQGKGTVRGQVTVLKGGKAEPPRGDTVVYLVGFDEPPPEEDARMEQSGRQFSPQLLPITRGQRVGFPNEDFNTNHNVFSHDPKFNLGQFRKGRGKAPGREFKDLGPVEVYCNIHSEMAATVLVLPNRRFARVLHDDGKFEIKDVPPGTWELFAYDRRGDRPQKTSVTVKAGQTSEVSLSVSRTDKSFAHRRADGSAYGTETYR